MVLIFEVSPVYQSLPNNTSISTALISFCKSVGIITNTNFQSNIQFRFSLPISCHHRVHSLLRLFHFLEGNFANIRMHIRFRGNANIFILFDRLIVKVPEYIRFRDGHQVAFQLHVRAFIHT